jgi:uncharacterized protein YkwD
MTKKYRGYMIHHTGGTDAPVEVYRKGYHVDRYTNERIAKTTIDNHLKKWRNR